MKIKDFVLFLFLCVCLSANAGHITKCEHVILIGADGFTSDVIRNNPGRYKHIEALLKAGWWTLESRSVLPSSSAINWKSMISGAGSEMHGFTDWGTKVPEVEPIYKNKWGMFPSIFGVTREQLPHAETGVIYSWDGIKYIFENEAVDYNKCCKDEDDEEVVNSAMQYIKDKKPNLLFVYFAFPDEVGHKYGWCSKEYNASCDTLDVRIGRLMETIKATFDMNKTAVVFNSDHGGINKGHGGKTMHEMQTPFAVLGARLEAGHHIDFPVMRYDVAPTIIQLLGLNVPDVWRGKSVLR